MRVSRWLEWLAITVAALAIAVGVIAFLSGGLLAGRDQPGVSGDGSPVGVRYRDQGHALLAPGVLRPMYDSEPPTSGAHVPVAVERDYAQLSDDQLLQALQVGDVVIMYGTSKPPAGLPALAASIAAPFTPALAAAGQAVILARRAALNGLVGLAWTRAIHVSSVRDPALRSFTQFWLGRGARRR